MSLRRLKNISKSCLLCDTSRAYISKRCQFRDVSETSQKYLSQVFVTFQKYPTKMVLLLVSVGLLQYLIKDVD